MFATGYLLLSALRFVPAVISCLLWVVGLYYLAFRYVYYILVLSVVLTAVTFMMLHAQKNER